MQGIEKSYGAGDARVHVLKNVSFRVNKGDFVAILGPSGSGKSTLMNLIGLIDTADEGQYWLGGECIADKTEDEFAAIRNQRLGFVFQKFNLIAKYSALQNVALPLLIRGYKYRDASARAAFMLNAVGLGDKLYNRPSQLSGGQQQRVAIARALIGNPDLLLADEPTGALDTQTGREILNLFTTINKRGRTIVLITHDMNIAAYASRIVRIEDGRVSERKPEITVV